MLITLVPVSLTNSIKHGVMSKLQQSEQTHYNGISLAWRNSHLLPLPNLNSFELWVEGIANPPKINENCLVMHGHNNSQSGQAVASALQSSDKFQVFPVAVITGSWLLRERCSPVISTSMMQPSTISTVHWNSERQGTSVRPNWQPNFNPMAEQWSH